ncbi:MAG: phage gp6-like head-tail connector protein [Rhodocyclaceae bacterium]|nr:phage gp6-like head-tail connector protein [Rhodocyclaceae bacterium]
MSTTLDPGVVKVWCRIDGDEFDAVLPMMLADAVAQAGHLVAGRADYYASGPMPASVQMWCCAQIAHWLETPSASVSPSGNNPQRNLFLDGLLDPYRLYGDERAQ